MILCYVGPEAIQRPGAMALYFLERYTRIEGQGGPECRKEWNVILEL